MADRDSTWGSDVTPSTPQPLKTTNMDMIDMDGFCFTPMGLRVNVSRVDRETFLSNGFGPNGGGRG